MEGVKYTRAVKKRRKELDKWFRMGQASNFKIEPPKPDQMSFPEVDEDAAPEWLTLHHLTIQDFYPDVNGTPQVIMNGVFYNCKNCHKPPSRGNLMRIPTSCSWSAPTSHPHQFCETCIRMLFRECNECFPGKPTKGPWIKVLLPANVLKHMDLVEEARAYARKLQGGGLKKRLEEMAEEELEEFVNSAVQQCEADEKEETKKEQKDEKEQREKQIKRDKELMALEDYEQKRRDADKRRVEGKAKRLQAIVDGGHRVCGVCFRVFKFKTAKFRHMSIFHPEMGYHEHREKDWKCSVQDCDFTCRDKFNLDRHKASRNCPYSPSISNQNKMCEKCKKLFRDSTDRKRHESKCKEVQA